MQAFNSQGQVSSQSDSNGNTTSLAYDGGLATATITDPQGRVLQHVSPGFTTITQAKDANGQVVNMGYDAAGRRTSIVDRLGQTTALAYDASSGYLSSITDALSETTKATFTAQSRQGFQIADLTKLALPDGTSISGTCDANGNLVKLVDQASKISTYSYDTHGQLLTITNPVGVGRRARQRIGKLRSRMHRARHAARCRPPSRREMSSK